MVNFVGSMQKKGDDVLQYVLVGRQLCMDISV